jgi:hypothetical protein
MKTRLKVLRDLARVLVGIKTKAVIDVTEESKPALEAFWWDVYRKYSVHTKLKRRRRTGTRIASHT